MQSNGVRPSAEKLGRERMRQQAEKRRKRPQSQRVVFFKAGYKDQRISRELRNFYPLLGYQLFWQNANMKGCEIFGTYLRLK